MALEIPQLADHTGLILKLEEDTTIPPADKIDRIKAILEGINDKGTVVYGLRTLSRFGVINEELESIARRFNGRIALLTEPGQPFYRIDPPYITSYVVETEGEVFERRDLSGPIL